MSYNEITIIISLFTLGLFGGFSHCAFMCGPFVLTQVGNRLSNIKIEKVNNFSKLSGIALLPYHLGRITTYCVIGILSSTLVTNLKNITGFKIISGVLLIIAALIFFSSTLVKIKLPFKIKLIKIFPSFAISWVRKRLKNLLNFLFLNPTGFKNYLLGIILGFIPCGLVYGAIVAVASLNNSLAVLLAMLVFGIATIPALFITACGGYWFFDKIKSNLKVITKIILSINILTLLIMAIGLIFNKI